MIGYYSLKKENDNFITKYYSYLIDIENGYHILKELKEKEDNASTVEIFWRSGSSRS